MAVHNAGRIPESGELEAARRIAIFLLCLPLGLAVAFLLLSESSRNWAAFGVMAGILTGAVSSIVLAGDILRATTFRGLRAGDLVLLVGDEGAGRSYSLWIVDSVGRIGIVATHEHLERQGRRPTRPGRKVSLDWEQLVGAQVVGGARAAGILSRLATRRAMVATPTCGDEKTLLSQSRIDLLVDGVGAGAVGGRPTGMARRVGAKP